MKELEHKDFIISYLSIPMFPNRWTVNLASNNSYLQGKLGENVVIDSSISIEDAIQKARIIIDNVLR
jgi:hypothetical protein